MSSWFNALLVGSLVIWATAVTTAVVQPFRAENAVEQAKTTNDGIYTTAQADGAKAQFEKICAECHSFTVATKKKPKDKPLGDDPFFEEWTGRPVKELVSVIHLTMPNDGSANVSQSEAADLVAYVLQQNGYAPGSAPLSKDSAAIIERPVKK